MTSLRQWSTLLANSACRRPVRSPRTFVEHQGLHKTRQMSLFSRVRGWLYKTPRSELPEKITVVPFYELPKPPLPIRLTWLFLFLDARDRIDACLAALDAARGCARRQRGKCTAKTRAPSRQSTTCLLMFTPCCRIVGRLTANKPETIACSKAVVIPCQCPGEVSHSNDSSSIGHGHSGELFTVQSPGGFYS
ncbi:hypothetical protein BS17DRAFT_341575 [Gyrodon lividus]|nr:hypothetical protein BS17DRAFT_341575 [Gyrodon lividus]